MENLEPSRFFAILVVMLASAKVAGLLARRFGQPSVLGELLAGIVVGGSVLGLVDPHIPTIHLMSELGVIVLLLAIGMETDLARMMKVGPAALMVAIVGVVAPFGMGYAGCLAMGLGNLESIMIGATLTATSVGITARVLSDLGRLGSEEGQVILGAAVIDDILGLIILAVVVGMVEGGDATPAVIGLATFKAFGFLAAVLVVGGLIVPPIIRLAGRVDMPGTPAVLAMILALGLAWMAEGAGSAPIIGAFAAGLLLAKTDESHEIERAVTHLGYFFVPLFFVGVGAMVDLSALDPRVPGAGTALMVGAMLIVVGVIGKFIAGYAAPGFKGDRRVVGVGMIPRGEVGLIFAQIGLAKGVLDQAEFGAVTLMVVVTTFLAPPLLRLLVAKSEVPGPPDEVGIADLVSGQ
jgi:Kef-type K+ transport system membrane component KefB